MIRRTSFNRLVPPFVAILAVVSFSAITARPAAAQIDANQYAKIVAHLVPYSQAGHNPCTSGKGLVGCNSMVVKGGLFPDSYIAYICVTDADRNAGIAGVQFGINYNGAASQGVDLWSWTICATLEFPQQGWPNPGTGNKITWDPQNNCQRQVPDASNGGVVAVAGYFYLTAYTPDRFEITRQHLQYDDHAKVANCAASETIVDGSEVHWMTSHLGYVSFSEGAKDLGYNPCGTNKPVTDETWSGVKARDK